MYILFSHFFLLLKTLLKLTPCISVILFYCFSPSSGQFQISTLIKVLLAVVKKLKQLIFYCASFESKFIPFRKKRTEQMISPMVQNQESMLSMVAHTNPPLLTGTIQDRTIAHSPLLPCICSFLQPRTLNRRQN